MIRGDQLMIGDWVLVDGTPRKVEAITKKKIGYHRKEKEPRLNYARLHDVEPIEINDYVLRISGDPQVIITNKDTHSCYVGGTRYVHEFQHLFRPCGVNFEVKL